MKLLPMKPAPPVTSMDMGVKVAGVGAKMTGMATSHRRESDEKEWQNMKYSSRHVANCLACDKR